MVCGDFSGKPEWLGLYKQPRGAGRNSQLAKPGNWVGVYVTNLNPIRWTEIITFTFK